MDAQAKKIKEKQSQYISKIQNLLEHAPHAEYSNKNLLKLQKQQREKLRLLQQQHDSLKASPGKAHNPLFDSTLHSE
jgi:ubiquinone biosynthesis protein COQ9